MICSSSPVEQFSVIIITRVSVTLGEIQCTCPTIAGKNDDRLDEETRSERRLEQRGERREKNTKGIMRRKKE